MQLGMIGLGRMGGNMTERCLQAGYELVVYDGNPETVKSYDGAASQWKNEVTEHVIGYT
jgi:6-phosphogluconate dehydrogenase